MAAFICRMCGGILELPDKSRICRCRACGVVQSVPFLDSAEKETACRNAERLRRSGHYDKAMELLAGLIKLSPTDADLYWAEVLCRYGVEFSSGRPEVRRALAKSLLSDEDYKTALKFADSDQRRLMERAAAEIDALRRKSSENALSVNSVNGCDIILVGGNGSLGSRLESKLTAAGYRVFNVDSVPNAGSVPNAENISVSALEKAGAMIIICGKETDLDNDLIQGFVNSGRAIIPVLDGISGERLPEELLKFQAADTSKLGWESDVLNGVAPIFKRSSPQAPPSRSANPMLRRIYIMLEDNDLSGAKRIADLLIEKEKNNPQICAEAYLAKLLCEYGIRSERELSSLDGRFTGSENYRRAMQLGDEGFRLRIRAIVTKNSYNATDITIKQRLCP